MTTVTDAKHGRHTIQTDSFESTYHRELKQLRQMSSANSAEKLKDFIYLASKTHPFPLLTVLTETDKGYGVLELGFDSRLRRPVQFSFLPSSDEFQFDRLKAAIENQSDWEVLDALLGVSEAASEKDLAINTILKAFTNKAVVSELVEMCEHNGIEVEEIWENIFLYYLES